MNDITKVLLGGAAGIVAGKTILKNTKIPGLGGVRKATKKRKPTKKRKTGKRKK